MCIRDRVYEARGISARGYHRVLKTARTIADLAGEEWIQKEHLSEAFGYRAVSYTHLDVYKRQPLD